MPDKTLGIVLSALPYSETGIIIKIYTRKSGLLSFFEKNILSKKAGLRKAYLVPLTLLDLEIDKKQTRSLQKIKDCRLISSPSLSPEDAVLNCIALFVSEVIIKSTQENDNNEILFDFLTTAIQSLKAPIPNTWLHFFLLNLSKHLGFYPLNNFKEGYYFNINEGRFQHNQPIHHYYLSADLSKTLSLLLNNEEVFTSSMERRQLLDSLLQYFKFHVSGFSDPKSLEIAREIIA